MNNLSFNYLCDLILEKKRDLEGTVEQREEAFLNVLKDRPPYYVAYERAVEILKHENDGLSINDLYKDAVSVDAESGKRPLQISQFKKMIDAASKNVGNIDFNVYSGTYSLQGVDLDDLRDGEIPNIEDMDDLDSEEDDGDDESMRNDLDDNENIKDALADYKMSQNLEDY